MRAALALVLIAVFATACQSDRKKDRKDELRRLQSLPYVEWVPPGDKRADGVVTFVADKVSPGWNLYHVGGTSRAVLMDLAGREVYSWIGQAPRWHHVKMASNGVLYGIYRDHGVEKVTPDSKQAWFVPTPAHHDLAIAARGEVYVLTREPQFASVRREHVLIVADFIDVVSADGNVRRRIALAPLFADAIDADVVRTIQAQPVGAQVEPRTVFDVFHTNTIDVVGEGRVLLCVRNLNLVALVELDPLAVVWSWGDGELDGPHHPTLLPSGTVLVFDNGLQRGYSRVVEFDPTKRRIVWEYRADGFFSRIRGGAQRLPNDNVLVTQSDNGRAFEVTRAGEIVWDFYNPVHRGDKRQAIYRMIRIERPPAELRLAR